MSIVHFTFNVFLVTAFGHGKINLKFLNQFAFKRKIKLELIQVFFINETKNEMLIQIIINITSTMSMHV